MARPKRCSPIPKKRTPSGISVESSANPAKGDTCMAGCRFALPVLVLLACVAGIGCGGNSASDALSPGSVQLHGAGATFPAPLYKKWFEEYHKRRPEVVLSYQDVGSGEGVKQFMAEAVDFAASDAAMNDEEMASVKRGVQLVPMTAGAIVLAYNLGSLGGPLKL